MKTLKDYHIAWLLPSVASGAHWQPILSGFLKAFPNTVFYTTSVWKEFDIDAPYSKSVIIVGELKSIPWMQKASRDGYNHGLMYLPLNIIGYLWSRKPNIVISNAFSIWSILAIFLKPFLKYKVIILYEGSTPGSDFKDSSIRSKVRKFIAQNTNVFIANTKAAKNYLDEFLDVKPDKILLGPYLLPDKTLMIKNQQDTFDSTNLVRPIFLFVGQIIKRKGIFDLLRACDYLNTQGHHKYSLLIIGEGSEREQLQKIIFEKNLSEQIYLLGQKSYDQLGIYFQKADVFIFPSFEDTWGMAPVEAMAFDKPVICSKFAGSSELICDGKNGYLIDPRNPEEIASTMRAFITDQNLALAMQINTREKFINYTIDASIKIFSEAVSLVN